MKQGLTRGECIKASKFYDILGLWTDDSHIDPSSCLIQVLCKDAKSTNNDVIIECRQTWWCLAEFLFLNPIIFNWRKFIHISVIIILETVMDGKSLNP